GEPAAKALNGLRGVKAALPRPVEPPVLVLLPYRITPATGLPEMRYAYRLQMRVNWAGQSGPFLLWVDADDGRLLTLLPFIDTGVTAVGAVWNRDPGIGTTTESFQVDASSGGQYTLQLAGFTNRLDYQGDGVAGYNAFDASISDSTNGSSATFANFNQ